MPATTSALQQWRPLQGWCLAWLAGMLVAARRSARQRRSVWQALTKASAASLSFWTCLFASAVCWALPFPRGVRGRRGALPQPKEGEAKHHGHTRYVRAGVDPSRELVVLVHGLSTPLEIYDPMVDVLVAAGFETLAFDWYGRGWSSADDSLQTIELIVAQLE